jgi:hypothetical protein
VIPSGAPPTMPVREVRMPSDAGAAACGPELAFCLFLLVRRVALISGLQSDPTLLFPWSRACEALENAARVEKELGP